MNNSYTGYFVGQKNTDTGEVKAVRIYDNMNVNYVDENRVEPIPEAQVDKVVRQVKALNMLAEDTTFEFVVVKRTVENAVLSETEADKLAGDGK